MIREFQSKRDKTSIWLDAGVLGLILGVVNEENELPLTTLRIEAPSYNLRIMREYAVDVNHEGDHNVGLSHVSNTQAAIACMGIIFKEGDEWCYATFYKSPFDKGKIAEHKMRRSECVQFFDRILDFFTIT